MMASPIGTSEVTKVPPLCTYNPRRAIMSSIETHCSENLVHHVYVYKRLDGPSGSTTW